MPRRLLIFREIFVLWGHWNWLIFGISTNLQLKHCLNKIIEKLEVPFFRRIWNWSTPFGVSSCFCNFSLIVGVDWFTHFLKIEAFSSVGVVFLSVDCWGWWFSLDPVSIWWKCTHHSRRGFFKQHFQNSPWEGLGIHYNLDECYWWYMLSFERPLLLLVSIGSLSVVVLFLLRLSVKAELIEFYIPHVTLMSLFSTALEAFLYSSSTGSSTCCDGTWLSFSVWLGAVRSVKPSLLLLSRFCYNQSQSVEFDSLLLQLSLGPHLSSFREYLWFCTFLISVWSLKAMLEKQNF